MTHLKRIGIFVLAVALAAAIAGCGSVNSGKTLRTRPSVFQR